MKAVLICPLKREDVRFLKRQQPLALVPLLGRTVLDLWLTELASRGMKKVIISAADRPEEIRWFVGRGEQWGLSATVVPEREELSVEEAKAKYETTTSDGLVETLSHVIVMDTLPTRPEIRLWESSARWFEALTSSQRFCLPDRVGMKEISEGIFVHVRAQIAKGAQLTAPVWIDACWVGDHCKIGPNVILEARTIVDDGAEVADSFVGPDTYVGAMTEVRESIAWGRGLLKWTTGSFTEISDDFLLGDLRGRGTESRTLSLLGQIAALLTLALTSPILLVAWLRRPAGKPWMVPRQAVRAPVTNLEFLETIVYHEFTGFRGLWRRWPQLWQVARGTFSWVGNRPLSKDEASRLSSDFEYLWLKTRPGLLSLADAEGAADGFDDETKVHSSYYAVNRNFRSDLAVIRRTFLRALSPKSATLGSKIIT
jgi:hypothetical protein